MRMEYYKCDVCLKRLSKDEGMLPLSVPQQISLKQNRIIRKELHVCEECYKPTHYSTTKEYESKLKAHIDKFFRNNKFYF